MFQDFDDITDPSLGAGRVAALRDWMREHAFDGVLVPREDAHQGEYIPKGQERLAWLTGFTGSAGFAVVLTDRAAVFVDGRYTLQVRDQVDTEVFEPVHLVDVGPAKFLEENVGAGHRIGFDPWLHTRAATGKLRTAIEKAGGELIPVDGNPIDVLWSDRPAPPEGPVSIRPVALSGRSTEDKIAEVQAALAEQEADHLVVTQLDNLAWLFNIRGADVSHIPLVIGFAIVPAEGRPELFVDGRKLSNEVRTGLAALVDIAEPTAFTARLDTLGANGARVSIESAAVVEAIALRIESAGGTVVDKPDPSTKAKALKTEAEIKGARDAHIRDGAAFARFLAWFDQAAPAGNETEISVAQALERFRSETGALKDISFDTISGFGPNGAIVHYRVTNGTNRAIDCDGLHLIDSGGQYEDGTTDITRTLPVGPPTEEMRRHYTLVLKGHLAISTARFPKGTTGAQLDSLARVALWWAGLDYDHGTGHGVGSYLGVHEGPQRLSKTGHIALEPGMILSNEPGYYRTGEYGIRIENLVVVTQPAAIDGGDKDMLGFETITFAPYDRRLIDSGLLTSDEQEAIDHYHKEVLEKLAPLVDQSTRTWLQAATAPIG